MPLLSNLNHRHQSDSLSTNSQLITEIKDAHLDATRPHLLTADRQSGGRGQHGRSWQSPKGNIYLSLYLPMTQPITGLFSLIVGFELAMMPVIQQLNTQLFAQGKPTIGVKWANDLGFYDPTDNDNPESNLTVRDNPLAADKTTANKLLFNKLAGILIEPIWQHGKLIGCVIGVGINILATPLLTTETLEGMSYRAISLADLWPQDSANPIASLALADLYEQVAQALIAAYTRFEQMRNTPSRVDDFVQLFAQVDALAGRHLQVHRQIQEVEETLSGVASGISPHGCLQLRLDDATLMSLFTGRIDVLSNPV